MAQPLLDTRALAWLVAMALLFTSTPDRASGASDARGAGAGDGAAVSAPDGIPGAATESNGIGPRNRVMGTGEPREPQPFTREQRLLEAARQGDRATVERALELGVPVDAADDLDRSVLLLAVRDAGDLDLVRYLHDRGAAIDRPDAGGRTPLSFAAADGRIELVRYLIQEGADVDSTDRRGRTPLFHSVLHDRRDTVAYLLDQGAAVDVADRYGDTPLMMACAKGYAEMARLLLDHGADLRARNQEGRTPADRAATGMDLCRPGGAA